MKKTWPIRTLITLLCMVMICSIPAHAVQTLSNEKIDLDSVTISKMNNGDFRIYVSVQTNKIMETIGASSVAIQRYTTFGWVTEYTFNTINTPSLQVENRDRYNTVVTYSPLFTGVDYRAVVMIYAKDASGSSSQRLTSRTVKA